MHLILCFLIAAEAQVSKNEIVFVDIALSDLRGLPKVNVLCAILFTHPPARMIYQAAALPFGGKVKAQAQQ